MSSVALSAMDECSTLEEVAGQAVKASKRERVL